MIPIVDFSPISIQKDEIDWKIDTVGKQLVKAFENVGFVYLTNVGITEEEIELFNKACAAFFKLSLEEKQEYARPKNGNHGYICIGLEALEQGRPPDLRECFNFTPADTGNLVWPNNSIAPKFHENMELLFQKCQKLSHRVLQALAIGVGYADVDFFTKSHKLIGKTGNCTTLRTLYYPQVPDDIIPNQIRCGEHSDYGSITLLFQDDAGGLQVKSAQGSYIEAAPVHGAVLVNIGDLLMRWSSDRFISTRHRVLLPESEIKRQTVRQSTAFFVHPDDDYVIECLDGSNKYPPISAKDYLDLKFTHSYGDAAARK